MTTQGMCFLMRIYFLFTFIFSLWLGAKHLMADTPTIQVLMAQDLKNIKIKGQNVKKSYLHRPFEKIYQGEQVISLDCTKKLSLQSSLSKGPLLASLSSSSGILEWKNDQYIGEFTVVRRPHETGCDLIQNTSLENYISTLVAKEMHRDWPLEALKAQAVAARSYALFKQQQRKLDETDQYYDLENSEKDQVSGALGDINENTTKAAMMTKGEVLVDKNGTLQPIFYHSKCGGHTNLPEDVWGKKIPGYERVECPFCKKMGKPEWHSEYAATNIRNKLLNLAWPNNPYKNFFISSNDLSILPHKIADQIILIKFQHQIFRVSKSMLRKNLGRDKIFSPLFTVTLNGSILIFKGEGLGHGVGMCQIGALELAKRGYTYKQILSFYYPNFLIKNYY